MTDYTLTIKGAEWVANRMVSSKYAKDIDTMYVVYTNSNIERLDLNSNITVSDLFSESSNIWCMKKEGGVIGYITTNDNKDTIANISCVVTESDVVPGGLVELKSGSSKIIAVAVAVSGEPDTIIAACNVNTYGASVPWVDNMPMSVTCPVCISAYPLEDK